MGGGYFVEMMIGKSIQFIRNSGYLKDFKGEETLSLFFILSSMSYRIIKPKH